MQAILTKYLGATNNKPARIKAWNADNFSITLPATTCEDNAVKQKDEQWEEASHRYAAEMLCEKMNWKGTLKGGGIKNGYAFVFVE